MHLAAQEDSLAAAELLYAAGSELDARTKAGYTPLHTACHFGQNGWTPGHVARRQHYLNIFEVLRQVTTCVESWEADDEELLEPKTVDGEAARALPDGTTRFAPGTRLLLEQPDVMADHAVTDTEEECVEPDYTVIPASPLFSRSASSGQAGLSQMVDGRSTVGARVNGFSKGGADKLSTVSGIKLG
ncbi:unnamed protein product [Echinostoma caproni]|uniref:ANK_REP_REGION domain-containing protein n=1 Tax=Echinostoma caproni TaxID=27848 RepID=A0A183AQP7_9TREM|nr:unnamed protein product [Echinostoma caproni]